MNQKYFKYESKNHKKIRLKDLLMIFSIFTLCVVTVVIAGTSVNKKNKLKVSKNMTKQVTDIQTSDKNSDEHVVSSNVIKTEIQNQTKEINQESVIFTPSFIKPVNGRVIKQFSPDNLIYSETMDDWRTHMGVDIYCPLGTEVIAAENGVITKISFDINYGNQVTVETGDYEHIYSSLSTDLAVKEGSNINKGDVIGTSSDSCISEICDEPHIHFEIKKNGIYINPTDLIEFN